MKCIAILKDNSCILYERMRILLPNGKYIKLPLPSKPKTILGRLRLFERLFRLEPRCGTFLSDDLLVITFQRQLLILSISKAKVIKTLPLRNGWSDILSFCSMCEYSENVVFYGDYGMNSQKDSVNIYKLNSLDYSSNVVYTFPKNSIRHIHNILYDKWRNQFVIFTGDTGKYVGIYIANKDFSKVRMLKGGSQQYRAVIGHVTETGLIYATDSVEEENHIYYLPFDNEAELNELYSINGSVIYGCNLENRLIVSTTVEPYPSKKSRILSLIDNRRGKGIKSNEVALYSVENERNVNKIATFQKDALPMRLFQYGCIQFPALQTTTIKTLCCSGIAIKKYDGKTLNINLV